MNLHWLITRWRIFISAFIDIFIFSLIFQNAFQNDNFLIIIVPYYLLIIFWISLSYIFGRYSKSISNDMRKLFNKDFKDIITLVIIFYFLHNICLIFGENLIGLLSSNKLFFYALFPIFSFASQFFIRFAFYEFDRKKIEVAVLGNKDDYDKHFNFVKESSPIYTSKISLKELKSEFMNKGDLILCTKLDQVENSFFIKQKQLNNIKIFSSFSWCEKRLLRIPGDCIQDRNILLDSWGYEFRKYHHRLKRIFDILFGLLLLILSAPFILLFSLLIKIEDGGPIFYEQIRTGLYGRNFKILKLRTMKCDAEKQGPQWAKKNDSRVTKLGKILRKTRIDELPQLIQVISGEMSLIGPRPERPEIDELLNKEIKNYSLRNNIKPGLSGWAQVNYPYGSSIKDSEIKLSYDLFYLRNFSILIDLVIFFKTIKLVFNSEGSEPNP